MSACKVHSRLRVAVAFKSACGALTDAVVVDRHPVVGVYSSCSGLKPTATTENVRVHTILRVVAYLKEFAFGIDANIVYET